MKKFFCVFLLVFTAIFSLFAQEKEITTITINNARQTSYKKADDSGNDTIILEGSVELEVKKSATSSKIKADRITYDRTTEMLYAEGTVENPRIMAQKLLTYLDPVSRKAIEADVLKD